MSGYQEIAIADLEAMRNADTVEDVRAILDRVEMEAFEASMLSSNHLSAVYFRAGLLVCRETMARFVEQGGDTATAQSIRANWWPRLSADPGAPRQVRFDEVTAGGDEGPWPTRPEYTASIEALPIAYAFMVAGDSPSEVA